MSAGEARVGIENVESMVTYQDGTVTGWHALTPNINFGDRVTRIDYRTARPFEPGWYLTDDGICYCPLKFKDGRVGKGPDPTDIHLNITLDDGTPYVPSWVAE